MNTGALLTGLGTALTAIVTLLVGWFVRRTDRAAKLTQANMHDQEYILKLVGALRHDYWAVIDWAYEARSKFMRLHAKVEGEVPAELGSLDELPAPKHRELENRNFPNRSNNEEEK